MKTLRIRFQGTAVEVTVVQKLNQSSIPKKGCNFFRGSFFVTFLEKQKSKNEMTKRVSKKSRFFKINQKHKTLRNNNQS